MTHPPSSRREEQKTEDVQLSKVNVRLNNDEKEPSAKYKNCKGIELATKLSIKQFLKQ